MAEAAVGVHERAGELVEVGDVAAAEREHDVAGQVVAGVLPPVGKQACSRRDRALGDDESLAFLGVGEVVAADAVADASERVALELVVLAAVLGQDEAPSRSTMPAKRPPAPTAGSWCGSPIRIAFPSPARRGRARARGCASRPCRPRRRRARSGRQATVTARMVEQAMKRDERDPGFVLELLGGDARRRGAEHGDAACANTWATAWVAVVLPAPARPTTQTTRLGLVATSRTIAPARRRERSCRHARSRRGAAR